MKIRTAVAALVATSLLFVGGCGSDVAGTAQPGPSIPVASDFPTALPSDLPSDLPTDLPTDLPSDLTDAPTEPSAPETEDSTPAQDTSEPAPDTSAPSTDEPLPTALPSGVPTMQSLPSEIPGASAECNAIYQVVLLFASPMTNGGQAITQAQVDAAFAGVAGAPADVQDKLATLKTAADGMVGKSGTAALMSLADPAVTTAITDITTYMQTSCMGG